MNRSTINDHSTSGISADGIIPGTEIVGAEQPVSRRVWLSRAALLGSMSALSSMSAVTGFAESAAAEALDDGLPALADGPTPAVAGILTTYFKGSHSDVLIGRLLEGWKIDGGPGPRLRLASLYIDQNVNTQFGRDLAKKYGIPVYDTIEGALTAGTSGIAMDGVLSVGEHGDYPRNELGQDLYPRRRFLTEITDAFKKYNRIVPVFNDKHLGPSWDDALWMYQTARDMKIPFMAGSSLPLSYRSPDLTITAGTDLESAVAIGYAELDRYGIHTLELLQTMTEKRMGGEVGVRWVECLSGDAMWQAIDNHLVPVDLIEAAISVALRPEGSDWRKTRGDAVCLIRFEYLDGFPAAVLMMGSGVQSCSVAVKQRNLSEPLATRAEERTVPRHPHFGFLLHAVERMIHTGVPSYPVERTLLTTGLLDRALRSRHQNGRRLETPELAIAYTPNNYPHAPNPPLPL